MTDLSLVAITGISKGLGAALAKEFLSNGVRVVGCARKTDNLDIHHERFTAFSVDVTDDEAVSRWSQEVIATFGVPDMLIQCAGTINQTANIEAISNAEFQTVVNVNLMGTVHGIQGFLPAMKQADQGMIINISSEWGRIGEKGLSAYCASKFAVEGLVQSVAEELDSKVKIYALDPGDGIQSDMLSTCLPEYYEEAPSAQDWAKCAYQYLLKIWQAPPEEVSLTVDLFSLNQ